MNKLTIFFILCLNSFLFAQSDLKDRLLNYDFDRVKISISARSFLVDLVKREAFDSVSIIISYCDSINYPDSSWLSKRERFLLKYLKADTSFLLDKSVYTTYLGLRDSAPKYDYYYSPYMFDNDQLASHRYLAEKVSYLSDNFPNFRLNLNIEDLGKILKLLALDKRNGFRNKFSNLSHLWDFLDLVFLFHKVNPNEIGKIGNEYLEKYSKSPFRDLVAYNFSERYKPSNHGGALTATILRYNVLPDETHQWIDDFPAVGFGVGYLYKHFSGMFNMSFLTVKPNSSLVYGQDTLSDTIRINPFTFDFSIGYITAIRNSIYITPSISYNIFSAHPIDSAGKTIDFKIPGVQGIGFSLAIDKRLSRKRERFSGYVANSRIGFTYMDFSKIKPGLGTFNYYAEIGIGVKGWARTRDYSF